MDNEYNKPSWIEVYKTTDQTRIALIETRLRSEGIEVEVVQQSLNQVFGGYFDISILVPPAQVDQAIQVLQADGYIPLSDEAGADAVLLQGGKRKPISMNKAMWSIIALIIMVLFALAYVYYLSSIPKPA